MTKQLKWMLLALGVLAILFLVNREGQEKLKYQSEQLISMDIKDIYTFHLGQINDSLTLVFDGTQWKIEGHDTLRVKEIVLENFFAWLSEIKRGTKVSQNPDNWDKYNVGDSTGTRLTLLDKKGVALLDIYVGRSSSNWSLSNVRNVGEKDVYQTDQNMIYRLNIQPDNWGEKPPEADSTAIDSL